ncbi:MAG: metal ABC transporter permease [Symbiobacteriia bacterium]
MQRALLAGLVVGAVAPMIGLFLVLRRLSLIGDTLSHASLAGVAAGFMLKIYPLATGLVFAFAAAFGVERLRETYKRQGELALAIVLSVSIALAVVLISLSQSFNAGLFSYLFGSLVTVTVQDVWVIAAVGLIVGAVVLLLYKEFFYITLDEELARVSGLPVRTLNLVMALLTAITVAAAMRIVGILLVSALTVLPVAAALRVVRSFRSALIVSIGFGEASVLGGIVTAYYLNFAPGGTVVLFAALLLLGTPAWRALVRAGGVSSRTPE